MASPAIPLLFVRMMSLCRRGRFMKWSTPAAGVWIHFTRLAREASSRGRCHV